MRLTTRLLLSARRNQRLTRKHANHCRMHGRDAAAACEDIHMARLYRLVDWLRGRLGERLADERMVECALGEAAYDGQW